ncbi:MULTISPECIES: TlpA disulfide reductase family protein [Bacillales]|uniref:TlpA disulfide reductase family protein n=1 Tax=Bacillales TaxID=1385 RepID=UPI000422D82C|nr:MULTISPECIES: TlpA disulfide reductase family protein [Bacillales]MDN4094600.1 TlpA disulfide reductase family protein [Brevibacillus agri]MED3500522.1 TlpA disulfide reductase family protein [Brevibacillus agri]
MKNVIAIFALLVLVAWGIYSTVKTPSNEANESVRNVNQGEQTNRVVGIEKGNMAPDFTLKSLDDQEFKLSQFKGKKVIINLWATWCPPCRAEMPDMQKFFEENKEDGLIILGVNLTQSEKSRDNVSTFLNEFGITFPVVLDEDNKVADTYQVVSIPTSYIIDSQGIIQEKIIGPMNKEMMEKLISFVE